MRTNLPIRCVAAMAVVVASAAVTAQASARTTHFSATTVNMSAGGEQPIEIQVFR